jgi:hypothetical protein
MREVDRELRQAMEAAEAAKAADPEKWERERQAWLAAITETPEEAGGAAEGGGAGRGGRGRRLKPPGLEEPARRS